jgi:hypothetical protein
MRNYWLRIVLGALAIFSVGMVGVTLARQGMGRVRGVVEGSGPITLPVAFVPFKLDGERIGTIQRITIHRNAPNQVRSVNVRVRLVDSVEASRLDPCILVAQGFENLNSETTFQCSSAEDTVGEDLAAVGEVSLTRGAGSYQLFMPRDEIEELTDSNLVFVGHDSAGMDINRHADSVAQAAELRAESILEARRPKLESLGVTIPRRPDAARRNRPVADPAPVQ